MEPHEPRAPDENPTTPLAGPTPTVVRVHEERVCVTVEYTPLPLRCQACQCAACRLHQPDPAVLYY